MNNEKSKILLTRTSQYVNKSRDYVIYIDEVKVGTIADGEEKLVEISNGKHEIYLKIDWCKSRKISLDVRPGETVKLKCGSRLTGIKHLLCIFYLFAKDQFVFLELG